MNYTCKDCREEAVKELHKLCIKYRELKYENIFNALSLAIEMIQDYREDE